MYPALTQQQVVISAVRLHLPSEHRPAKALRFAPHLPTRLSSFLTEVQSRLIPSSSPSTSESAIDGNTTVGSSSVGVPRTRHPRSSSPTRKEDDDAPVSHIVVDADWSVVAVEPYQLSNGEALSTRGESSKMTARTGVTGGSEAGSWVAAWWERTPVYTFVVRRAYPLTVHFFRSSFSEPKKEEAFMKEAWFLMKPAALLCSVFYLVVYILACAFVPRPWSSWYYAVYIGLCLTCVLPLLPLIAYDTPRRRPLLYQPLLFLATWSWAFAIVAELKFCGALQNGYSTHCPGRVFDSVFFYATGLPTLSALVLGQQRIYMFAGAVGWAIYTGVSVTPERRSWIRNLIIFILYHAFLLAISYFREKSDRRLWSLRDQLKHQYRATQAAQVAERRASDSKRKFVSYIFHEIRVPLNTALLAVQNLDGERCFTDISCEQREMVDGLLGSLSMMEKVLNDVLSFHRMESGKFSYTLKPFDFSKAVQMVVLAHRMQAHQSKLLLSANIDPEVERLGGIFVGDEIRFRQVLGNLVSNACKFTEHGSVTINAKLLHPRTQVAPAPLDTPPMSSPADSSRTDPLLEKNADEKYEMTPSGAAPTLSRRASNASARTVGPGAAQPLRTDIAIVRVDVKDTGLGLRCAEVEGLFSPYTQTEVGKRQGGKGSGLGLALCRQIVKLLGGRLGVNSRHGEGSTFWFELPFVLPPPKARSDGAAGDYDPKRPSSSGGRSIKEVDTFDGPPSLPSHPPTLPQLPNSPAATYQHPQALSEPASPFSMSTPLPSAASETLDNMLASHPPALVTSDSESTAVASDRSTSFSGPVGAPPPMHVLVVDDDKLTRMLMSRMLGRIGHLVTCAEDGEAGLNIIRDSVDESSNHRPQFDCVFLDNQMPRMTGVEVAREVRRIACPLYICGITGNALKEDQEEYIRAGADQILTKPAKEADLRVALDEARKRSAGQTSPKWPPTHDPMGK